MSSPAPLSRRFLVGAGALSALALAGCTEPAPRPYTGAAVVRSKHHLRSQDAAHPETFNVRLCSQDESTCWVQSVDKAMWSWLEEGAKVQVKDGVPVP